jgi:hypothetical protein
MFDEKIVPMQQNKPWTGEDDQRLIEMRAAGRTIAFIAAALKRSSGGIAGRLALLRARSRAEAKADRAAGHTHGLKSGHANRA